MFSHLDQPPWRATSANAQTVSSPLCRPIAIRVSKTSSRVCSRWWPDSASASRARSPSWDRWNSAQRATPSWRLASVAAYAPPRSQAPTRPAASPTDTSTAPDAWATTVGKPCAAHSRATEIHAGGTAASAGPGAETRYSVAEGSSPSNGSLAVGAESRASGATTSTAAATTSRTSFSRASEMSGASSQKATPPGTAAGSDMNLGPGSSSSPTDSRGRSRARTASSRRSAPTDDETTRRRRQATRLQSTASSRR